MLVRRTWMNFGEKLTEVKSCQTQILDTQKRQMSH